MQGDTRFLSQIVARGVSSDEAMSRAVTYLWSRERGKCPRASLSHAQLPAKAVLGVMSPMAKVQLLDARYALDGVALCPENGDAFKALYGFDPYVASHAFDNPTNKNLQLRLQVMRDPSARFALHSFLHYQ